VILRKFHHRLFDSPTFQLSSSHFSVFPHILFRFTFPTTHLCHLSLVGLRWSSSCHTNTFVHYIFRSLHVSINTDIYLLLVTSHTSAAYHIYRAQQFSHWFVFLFFPQRAMLKSTENLPGSFLVSWIMVLSLHLFNGFLHLVEFSGKRYLFHEIWIRNWAKSSWVSVSFF